MHHLIITKLQHVGVIRKDLHPKNVIRPMENVLVRKVILGLNVKLEKILRSNFLFVMPL